jgi:hypothetical protein
MRMARPGRAPATLLPVDPASDAAYEVYKDIFTRIGATVNVALGHNSRRSSALALLVTRWMRGFPLARLIQDCINWHATGERPVATSTAIRTVLCRPAPICFGSVQRPDLAEQILDLA